MKNKVLINVYVPSIDNTYEMYVPINESVNKVLELIIKSIKQLSDSNFESNISHYLLDPDTGCIYPNYEIMRNTNIENSKKIVLL